MPPFFVIPENCYYEQITIFAYYFIEYDNKRR